MILKNFSFSLHNLLIVNELCKIEKTPYNKGLSPMAKSIVYGSITVLIDTFLLGCLWVSFSNCYLEKVFIGLVWLGFNNGDFKAVNTESVYSKYKRQGKALNLPSRVNR